MEEQHPVGDVAHSRELVGRDDHRRRTQFANEARARGLSAHAQLVVDEKQSTRRAMRFVEGVRADELWIQLGLDRPGVEAPETGEAMQ